MPGRSHSLLRHIAEPFAVLVATLMNVSTRRGYKLVCSLFCSLTFALLLATTGCGGTASPPPSQKTLTAIAASPSSASLSVGATEQFKATATFSDGSSQDVTPSATWTDA